MTVSQKIVKPTRNKLLTPKLNISLELDYVDRNRIRAKHKVALVDIEHYTTGAGSYRVAMRCRTEDKPRILKPFLINRIFSLTDMRTGEVIEDVKGFLSNLIDQHGGIQPNSWPSPEEISFRTTDIDIIFNEDGYAQGWAFGVTRAFLAALDIVFETISSKGPDGKTIFEQAWTRGVPPRYAFETGDILYSPFPYGPATVKAIQVKDTFDYFLLIKIMTLDNCKVMEVEEREVSQRELADMLCTGIIPNRKE